jgi:hypothetical protein
VVVNVRALPDWLDPLWLIALADAGFEADEVVLLPVEGNAFVDARPALTRPPGETLRPEDWLWYLAPDVIGEANMLEALELPRVFLRCEAQPESLVQEAIVLGLLRHELEHARQFCLLRADDLRRLDERVAHLIADRLDGNEGATHYRAKPVEVNANAAAARLVRARYPNEAAELRASHRFAPLATETAMFADDELARAMTVFVAERGEMVDVKRVLGSGKSLKALVDEAYPGAYKWWPESDM